MRQAKERAMLINRNSLEGTKQVPNFVVLPDGENTKEEKCPLKHIDFAGRVVGPMFNIGIVQQFEIPSTCKDILEAEYSFPVPYNSVVNNVTVRFGDKLLKASLERKEKAKEQYEQAKAEGRQASLVSQSSPTVLALKINGIVPGQTVIVSTYISGIAPYRFGKFSLTLPTTVMTESVYSNNEPKEKAIKVKKPKVKVSDDKDLYKASINLQFSHCRKDGSKSAGSEKFNIKKSFVPDHDVVLEWLPEVDKKDSNRVYVFEQFTPNGTKAFAGLVVPTEKRTDDPVEVLIAVDHSGSMGYVGNNTDPRNIADRKALEILQSLRPTDRFNLCTFHSTIVWLSKESVEASPRNLCLAKAMLSDTSSGGTEMNLVFSSAAIQKPKLDNSCLFIVTDGAVDGDIFTQGELEVRPVHIVSISSSYNQFLVDEVCSRSGGEAICVDSGEDFEKSFDAIKHIIRLSYKHEGPQIQASPDHVKWLSGGNIPSCRPYVFGGLTTQKDANIKFSSDKEDKWNISRVSMDDFDILPIVGGLVISQMESDLSYGYGRKEPKINLPLADVSLEFGVLCQETSFVLVGEVVGKTTKEIEVPLMKSARIGGSCLRGIVAARGMGGGTSGYSGYSGYSGCSGPTGPTGFSGSSGCSGTSGFSGFSGAGGFYSPLHTPSEKGRGVDLLPSKPKALIIKLTKDVKGKLYHLINSSGVVPITGLQLITQAFVLLVSATALSRKITYLLDEGFLIEALDTTTKVLAFDNQLTEYIVFASEPCTLETILE